MRKAGVEIPKKYFLYVGNAYPHKNLERLCQAFLRLKKSSSWEEKNKNIIQELKLILVGKKDFFYRRLIEKVTEIGIKDEIIFFGEADRKTLDFLYKGAIALVFPSLMEGFGLPAIEAMKNGCLVLASDIPVFHEILGKAVIYFDPFNIDDLTQKMKTAIIFNTSEYEKYEKLRQKGLVQVKKYSWERLAKETLEVYRSI